MRLFKRSYYDGDDDDFKWSISARHVISIILHLNHHNYEFYDICILKLYLLFINDFHAAKLNKNWAIHKRAQEFFIIWDILRRDEKIAHNVPITFMFFSVYLLYYMKKSLQEIFSLLYLISSHFHEAFWHPKSVGICAQSTNQIFFLIFGWDLDKCKCV